MTKTIRITLACDLCKGTIAGMKYEFDTWQVAEKAGWLKVKIMVYDRHLCPACAKEAIRAIQKRIDDGNKGEKDDG